MSKSPKGSYKGTKAANASPGQGSAVPAPCASVLTPPQCTSASLEPTENPARPVNPANQALRSSFLDQNDGSTKKQKEHVSWKEAGAPKIPAGLSDEEKRVYQSLIKIRYCRMNEKSQTLYPAQVIVITDLGKDYDDLTAMVVLKELHRLGLIRLLGFIANLHPAKDRARFGRGCLNSLGLEDVPIAWGEEPQADPSKRTEPKDYEFPYREDYFKDLWGSDLVFTPYDQDKSDPAEIESGVTFLDRLVKEKAQSIIRDPGVPKLTFLLISSLSDIATFAKREPELLAMATDKVILQGDYSLQQTSSNLILTPNTKAANNGFDPQAAKEFHEYIDNGHIPSVVYTKEAAIAASLPSEVFREASSTKQCTGVHLHKIHKIQDRDYYKTACGPKEKRFMEHMDQEWFLKGKTNWYRKHSHGDPTPLPVGADVLPYVQLVCYDALAALGTIGDDALEETDVLSPRVLFESQGQNIHKIVGKAEVKASEGVEAVPADSGINRDRMKLVLTALFKGSLLALEEGIPSTHNTNQAWERANAAV